MSYTKSVLQQDEQVVMMGRLHWIIYQRAIWYLLAGVILLLIEYEYWNEQLVMAVTAALFGGLALISAVHAWFIRWITEVAVTDKRIIYKRGFINRHTLEMNMDKVETVDVEQSILGRLLNYGTIYVRGTGISIEPLPRIERPLELRNAIVAK